MGQAGGLRQLAADERESFGCHVVSLHDPVGTVLLESAVGAVGAFVGFFELPKGEQRIKVGRKEAEDLGFGEVFEEGGVGDGGAGGTGV